MKVPCPGFSTRNECNNPSILVENTIVSQLSVLTFFAKNQLPFNEMNRLQTLKSAPLIIKCILALIPQ